VADWCHKISKDPPKIIISIEKANKIIEYMPLLDRALALRSQGWGFESLLAYKAKFNNNRREALIF